MPHRHLKLNVYNTALKLFPAKFDSLSSGSELSKWYLRPLSARNLRATFNSFLSFYSDIQWVTKSCVFYLFQICQIC